MPIQDILVQTFLKVLFKKTVKTIYSLLQLKIDSILLLKKTILL